jgi:hypothetical protein
MDSIVFRAIGLIIVIVILFYVLGLAAAFVGGTIALLLKILILLGAAYWVYTWFVTPSRPLVP